MTQRGQVVDVVVGALVQDGRILLAHRSPTRRWYPGVWDLPGGHVEHGESRLEALVRELDEELGVEVTEDSCTAVTTLAPTAGDRVAELWLSIWSVRQWRGTPFNRCFEEHDRLEWFGATDLGGLTLAHEPYQDLLGSLLRGR